jgi:hypothetical protein
MTRSLLRIPLATTALLFAISFLPRIANSPGVRFAFWLACAVLLAWQLVLWLRPGPPLRVRFVPVRSHWVQALVQFSIYLYWGWVWRPVYDFMPVLLGQVVFLTPSTTAAAVVAAEGGSPAGPLPITFSTNFFLWFRDEWFYFQFAQLAVGSLGKEFVRWKRDGRWCHIFNPSAFSLTVASVLLLATGTSDITWGEEIATKFASPDHVYLWVFLGGLVVQSFFRVTLVTFGAVFALFVLNALYTWQTGVYFFLDSNIPAAVFLGLHLLVTDPATSPRTLTGKALLGMLTESFPFYSCSMRSAHQLWISSSAPILNLSVRAIDGFTRTAFVQRLRDRITMGPGR